MKARYLLLGGLAALGIALGLAIRGLGPAVERSTGVIRGPNGTVEVRYLLCSGQRVHFVGLLDYGPGYGSGCIYVRPSRFVASKGAYCAQRKRALRYRLASYPFFGIAVSALFAALVQRVRTQRRKRRISGAG